jgi:hypothetical protein
MTQSDYAQEIGRRMARALTKQDMSAIIDEEMAATAAMPGDQSAKFIPLVTAAWRVERRASPKHVALLAAAIENFSPEKTS